MELRIVVFILIMLIVFIMLKKGMNVGIVMLMSSIGVAVITKITFSEYFSKSFEALISVNTITLLLIMYLILVIENIMRTSGMINNIVISVKNLFLDVRFSGIIMPIVIGMLPSPGGARFSCPIVDDVIGNSSSNVNKAYINYWFRHIWMDGFILYPGIIIASKILNISELDLFLRLIPFMLVAFLIGIIFSIRNVEKKVSVSKTTKKENLKSLLFSMLPIIILIFLYVILLNFSELALEISALIVSVGLLILKKYNISNTLKALKSAAKPNLVLIIVGVMIFKDILLESGAIQNFTVMVNEYNIPIEILFFIIPFIGGVTSGISISFVSMTFPILIPMGIQDNIWYCALAFVSGFIGVMITPLHLCGVLTAEYFKIGFGELLLKILYSEIIIFVLVSVLFYLT